MLTNPRITGIDPFVPWSTFRCATLTIPRGLFYGGCFYTADNFTPPCHISYITATEWGISDSANTELAVIRFSGNLGNIYTLSGEYAGCLKGRFYNYDNTPVVSGATVTDGTSDLSIFLKNITGTHQLDQDSLILDCCNCYRIPSAVPAASFDSLRIPADGELAADVDTGAWYIRPVNSGAAGGGDYLSALTISGATTSVVLSGAHISITPWCADAANVYTSGGRAYASTWTPKGIGDVVVMVIDGGIVIGTHKGVSDYGA